MSVIKAEYLARTITACQAIDELLACEICSTRDEAEKLIKDWDMESYMW